MRLFLSVILLLILTPGVQSAFASPPDPLAGPPAFGAAPEKILEAYDAPPEARETDHMVFAATLTGKPALAAYFFSDAGLCYALWAYRELPPGALGPEQAFDELSVAAARRLGRTPDDLSYWDDDPAIARGNDWLDRLGVRGYRLERSWVKDGALLTIFISGPEDRPVVGLEWTKGTFPACPAPAP